MNIFPALASWTYLSCCLQNWSNEMVSMGRVKNEKLEICLYAYFKFGGNQDGNDAMDQNP